MIFDATIMNEISGLKQLITERGIGFFDFGCSHGEGVLWTQSKTDTVGLGFDKDPKKLKLADAKGVLCCGCDILKLPNAKFVSFTTIFHMLEHLGSIQESLDFIKKACVISIDNVFIRQPFYDSDPSLFHDGLKTYYSHWTGHRNQMTTPDFYILLDKLRTQGLILDFAIGYKLPILNSDSIYIHSLASPKDSLHYDPRKHPPKPAGVIFEYPLYHEIQVAIDINGQGFGRLWKKLAPNHIAYDSHTKTHKKPFMNSLHKNIKSHFNSSLQYLKEVKLFRSIIKSKQRAL